MCTTQSGMLHLSLEHERHFDYLDNVSGGNQRVKEFKYGNPNTNDAYYFLGISITRTFYDIPCPRNPYK
jgi:hypothetical protein